MGAKFGGGGGDKATHLVLRSLASSRRFISCWMSSSFCSSCCSAWAICSSFATKSAFLLPKCNLLSVSCCSSSLRSLRKV